MPADAISAVAALLSQALGYFVSPTGYEQLARDNKLKFIGRAIDAAITRGDWATTDQLFAAYRQLQQEDGP